MQGQNHIKYYFSYTKAKDIGFLDKQNDGCWAFTPPAHCHSDPLCGPAGLLFNGWRRLLKQGVKELGHVAAYSPPLSTEVVNEWSYTSLPPARLRVLQGKYKR